MVALRCSTCIYDLVQPSMTRSIRSLACSWFSEILCTHLNHLNLLEYALSRAALTPTTDAMISMDMDSWWTAGFGYDLLPIYPPSSQVANFSPSAQPSGSSLRSKLI